MCPHLGKNSLCDWQLLCCTAQRCHAASGVYSASSCSSILSYLSALLALYQWHYLQHSFSCWTQSSCSQHHRLLYKLSILCRNELSQTNFGSDEPICQQSIVTSSLLARLLGHVWLQVETGTFLKKIISHSPAFSTHNLLSSPQLLSARSSSAILCIGCFKRYLPAYLIFHDLSLLVFRGQD